jgi:hypothetical protein
LFFVLKKENKRSESLFQIQVKRHFSDADKCCCYTQVIDYRHMDIGLRTKGQLSVSNLITRQRKVFVNPVCGYISCVLLLSPNPF